MAGMEAAKRQEVQARKIMASRGRMGLPVLKDSTPIQVQAKTRPSNLVSIFSRKVRVAANQYSLLVNHPSPRGRHIRCVQRNNPSSCPGCVLKQFQVTVGGSAGLVYTPDSLIAQPGDMVHFHFLSKNHTVTQSSFAKPCVKLADGADSGFLPNGDETLNPPPSYKFQVLDTKPICTPISEADDEYVIQLMFAGFYCKQKGHCGKGMAFSVNPTEEKSQAKFKQAAIDQNGAADGTSGASGASASPPAGSTPSNVAVLAAGTGVAAPSGTAPAATGISIPPGNSTVYSAPLQPPQQNNGIAPPAPAASLPPNVVEGTGQTASSQCSCSCFCGVSAFPEGAGLGMMGGMPG